MRKLQADEFGVYGIHENASFAASEVSVFEYMISKKNIQLVQKYTKQIWQPRQQVANLKVTR